MKIRVDCDESYGRYLVASEDIMTPGTNVLVEQAYSCSSHEENMLDCCFSCQARLFKVVDSCINCGYLFCSTLCKQTHDHSMECALISELKLISSDLMIDFGLVLIVFRICLRFINKPHEELLGPDMVDVQLGLLSTHTRCDLVQSLQTHEEDIDPQVLFLFKKASSLIESTLADRIPNSKISFQTILNIFCVILVNAHGLCASGFSCDSGTGLFPIVSLLSHDCRPNCCFVTICNKIYVRSVAPILKNEKISISYIDLTQPTKIRRRELLSTKYFICECFRCCSETECDVFPRSYPCSHCKVGWVVPIINKTEEVHCSVDNLDFENCDDFNDAFDMFDEIYQNKEPQEVWQCHSCKSIDEDSKGDVIESSIQRLLSENPNVDVIEKLNDNKVSSCHYLLYGCLTRYCSNDSKPKHKRIKYLNEVINILEKILPPFHFEISSRYKQLSLLYDDDEQADAALDAAKRHIQVVYPNGHFENSSKNLL
ncbi:histone-lysine N-methyltransferase [Acrasis kona]|uniref:Histone-lysine N-methyltransferase n=1 Tax=Acrasis kona TaxID=1008807 RepID=A0AAW2ZJ11_9EUKA